MNKTTSAINNIFADSKVSAKFAEVTNREVIEQHVGAEYGHKLKKLTGVSDNDYARIIQASKEHFYRAATEYCGSHPDTNMITAMLFVMNQAEVNKVAERYVLGTAPVKGMKALFSGARNLASKAYETAFPERNFDTDVKEFTEDLKESGREVREELKQDFNKAKAAVQEFKNQHPNADEDDSPANTEVKENVPDKEQPATEDKEQPKTESDSEGDETKKSATEEEEEDIPHCVHVIVMGVGDPGEMPEIPEEVMKSLPEGLQEILKEITKKNGEAATEPEKKEENPD